MLFTPLPRIFLLAPNLIKGFCCFFYLCSSRKSFSNLQIHPKIFSTFIFRIPSGASISLLSSSFLKRLMQIKNTSFCSTSSCELVSYPASSIDLFEPSSLRMPAHRKKKSAHRLKKQARILYEEGALSLSLKLQKRTDLHNYGFDQSATIYSGQWAF